MSNITGSRLLPMVIVTRGKLDGVIVRGTNIASLRAAQVNAVSNSVDSSNRRFMPSSPDPDFNRSFFDVRRIDSFCAAREHYPRCVPRTITARRGKLLCDACAVDTEPQVGQLILRHVADPGVGR